jgi:hypothetical protein
MTVIEYPALLNLTDAPVGVPYRYGLSSVVNYEPIGSHGRAGLAWRSDACSLALITEDACKDPAVEALTASDCGYDGSADPFTAYIYDTDSLAGLSLADHEDQARTRFLIAEQWGVENYVAGLLTAAGTAAGSVVDMTTSAGAGGKFHDMNHSQILLAQVESQLALMSGNDGVIYMSRFSAMALGGDLVSAGGMLRTRLGTPVAAFGGWPTVSKNQEITEDIIFGTGPIKAQRGDVEIYSGTPGLSVNDASVIAERSYVFGWDCGIVGASATI